MTLQIPSMIDKIQTLKDKTLKIQVFTQELTPEQNAKLFELNQKIGWFVFSESKIKEEEVLSLPEIPKEFKGQKSASERLRNVLYLVWQKTTSQSKPFEEWRLQKMEEVIEHFKSQLN